MESINLLMIFDIVFLCVMFDFILIKGVVKRKDGYIFH